MSRVAVRSIGIALIAVGVISTSAAQSDIEHPPARSAPADTPFWRIAAAEVGNLTDPKSAALEAHIDRLIAEMSDEERVAQLLMVGWATQQPTPEIMRWIRERNIGGVKIFGWNGGDLPILAAAIAEMQSESVETRAGVPLFTATDQEGGWVRHVKDGTSVTPGNMAIDASTLPYDALKTGEYIGLELRALGINMNFAPTVDVYRNPEAHVIGPRAFSSDARSSGLLGVAFYRGLELAGVMATAKHFPGHGNASGDSHGILPVIKDDPATLWRVDLLPFRMLIREGVPAVLSGHLSFPEITGSNAPASISPYFKQHVLRDRLEFPGIVITDDLYMGGALEYGTAQGWSFERLVKEAVLAGNDMIMLSRTPAFNGSIWRTLINAYQNEPEFRDRVDESVRRILRAKLTYLRPSWRVPLSPNAERIREVMRTPAARSFFLDQAGRSVTVLRDADIPLIPESGERVLLAGKDPTFFRVGRSVFPGADEFRFRDIAFYSSSTRDRDRFARLAGNYDTIIYLLSDPASVQVLEAAGPVDARLIVYSILTPIYLAELPWVENAIAVYGWGSESFESGFSALLGEIPAPGRLPISSEFMPLR